MGGDDIKAAKKGGTDYSNNNDDQKKVDNYNDDGKEDGADLWWKSIFVKGKALRADDKNSKVENRVVAVDDAALR